VKQKPFEDPKVSLSCSNRI